MSLQTEWKIISSIQMSFQICYGSITAGSDFENNEHFPFSLLSFFVKSEGL